MVDSRSTNEAYHYRLCVNPLRALALKPVPEIEFRIRTPLAHTRSLVIGADWYAAAANSVVDAVAERANVSGIGRDSLRLLPTT